MARRKMQIHREYRFGPRSVLSPGDRFRVRGGPIYIRDDGTAMPFYERGVFVFHRYCVRGAEKWIEAYRADGGGIVLLWMGKSSRSSVIPSIRRRPYRIIGRVGTRRRRRQGRGGRHETGLI